MFSDALGALSHLSRRQVRQTSTFRGPLEIGSSLKINVWAYIRVSLRLSCYLHLFVDFAVLIKGHSS